jgi:hypothetical protein
VVVRRATEYSPQAEASDTEDPPRHNLPASFREIPDSISTKNAPHNPGKPNRK